MAACLALTEAAEVRPLDLQPTKFCGVCRTEKPRSEFHKRSSVRDGLQANCKACKAQWNRDAHQRSNRGEILAEQKAIRQAVARDYMWEYLATHPCVDCGEPDRIVLEFDHVRGEKSKEVSVLVFHGYSLDVVKAEIEKCDVRCANCHRRVTAKRAGTWRTNYSPL